MKYDAVIFDLFGTLVDYLSNNEHQRHTSDMATALKSSEDEMERVWRDTVTARDLGRFGSVQGDVEHLIGLLGNSKPDPEMVTMGVHVRLDRYKSYLMPRAGAIETLTQLRSSGLKTGLVTACSLEVPAVWKETLFAPLFDSCVFSSVEGMAKPDPRIYLLACERLGVTPEKCLYVGDGSHTELAGAQSVGMHPVMIQRGIRGIRRSVGTGIEEWNGQYITSLTDALDLL